MSDLSNAIATITPTAISPSHPAGAGKSQPGGHVRMFRAQPEFAAEAKLAVTGGNSWRPGCPGHRFYEQVLAQGPATVGECIEKAAALSEPFTAKQCQGHLRWIYTANGAFLEVDGQRYSAPAPQAPAKKKKAKVAAKAAANKVAVKRSKKVA